MPEAVISSNLGSMVVSEPVLLNRAKLQKEKWRSHWKNQKTSSVLYIFREIQIFTSSATGQDYRIKKKIGRCFCTKKEIKTQVFF